MQLLDTLLLRVAKVRFLKLDPQKRMELTSSRKMMDHMAERVAAEWVEPTEGQAVHCAVISAAHVFKELDSLDGHSLAILISWPHT